MIWTGKSVCNGQHEEGQDWVEIEGDSKAVIYVLKGVLDIKQKCTVF